MESGELVCSVSVEQLATSGEVVKKSQYKNATVTLGRNEFRDIILKLDSKTPRKYVLRDLTIHKKFVKDGKATIKLPDRKMQFLMSNCPPDRLILFLKTLSTKLECLKQNGFVSERKKFQSELPRIFQEISPLNMKELHTVHNMRAKAAESKDFFTPNRKRKYHEADCDKENRPPKGSKVAKKLPTSPAVPKMVANPIKLNADQSKVLEAVKSGQSIFFTGSAGTGKSFLLRRIVGTLPPQHTFATASTGVAACHISGTTLHAFAGIGSGTAPLEQCMDLAMRPVVAQQWRKCRHLIIDEISMVDGDFFTKLDAVARVVKKNNEPFGGIQLILCGDFLQLPPVSKHGEKKKFCFQSKAWRKCIHRNMELTEVRRQSDKKFVDLLQDIRLGRCSEDVVNTLTATAKNQIDKNGILATRLCTHKEDVDQINQMHLQKLTGEPHTFDASDSDPQLTRQIDRQVPVPQKLILKIGTQVMLAKNLDVQRGLVNGARGVVVGFDKTNDGLPIVKFICGVTTVIRTQRWSFKAGGGVYLSRSQLPIKLAWAISIHKSQGMSLDCVEISLSRVFESGQAYVALSRARSLEGLRVLDFNRSCVRANPEVLKFYRQLSLEQKMHQTTLQEGKDYW